MHTGGMPEPQAYWWVSLGVDSNTHPCSESAKMGDKC